MKEASKDPELKENIKAVAGFVPKAAKTISKMPSERKTKRAKIRMTDEQEIIESTVDFLKERFNAKIDSVLRG